ETVARKKVINEWPCLRELISGVNSIPLGLGSKVEWVGISAEDLVKEEVSSLVKKFVPGVVVKSLTSLLGSSVIKILSEEVDPSKRNARSSQVLGKEVPSNLMEREVSGQLDLKEIK
ncbi:hypothetical protein KI387_030545, partial [Taxus chinensis]